MLPKKCNQQRNPEKIAESQRWYHRSKKSIDLDTTSKSRRKKKKVDKLQMAIPSRPLSYLSKGKKRKRKKKSLRDRKKNYLLLGTRRTPPARRRVSQYVLAIRVELHVPQPDTLHQALRLIQLSVTPEH